MAKRKQQTASTARQTRPASRRLDGIKRFDGVILLSGGLDSTVLAYHAAAEGKSLRAIYLDYGSYAALPELNSARRTAHRLGMPLEVIDLSRLLKAFVGYVPLPQVYANELDIVAPFNATPYAFVSFAVPLAIASYYAQAVESVEVYVGAVEEQKSGRKDLAGFFAAWPKTVSLVCDPSAPELVVRTPFLDRPKLDVIKLGQRLGVPLSETWSCRRGNDQHDGVCPGCAARRNAFTRARVKDTTPYAE